jgi:hypothetical protein
MRDINMSKIKMEVDIDVDDALTEIDIRDVVTHYDPLDLAEAFSEIHGDEAYLSECSLPKLLRAVADKIEKYEAKMKEKI